MTKKLARKHEPYIPLRKCCVCGSRLPKAKLLRIIKLKDGTMMLDVEQKSDGRGAYICLDGDCRKNAKKKKALERSFKKKVSLDVYAEIL